MEKTNKYEFDLEVETIKEKAISYIIKKNKKPIGFLILDENYNKEGDLKCKMKMTKKMMKDPNWD